MIAFILSAATLALASSLASADIDAPSCTISECGFDAKDFERSRRVASVKADQQGDALQMDFYWTIGSDDMLTMGIDVTGARPGWLGFGISANGGMMGADIIVLRKDSGGSNFILEDRFAEDWATPLLDDHQDVVLLSAVRDEDKARTSFSLTRYAHAMVAHRERRETVTNMDIDIHPSRPSEIIWAMGYDDNFYQHDGDVRSRGKISGFMWTGSEGSGSAHWHLKILPTSRSLPKKASLSWKWSMTPQWCA